jgi:hypothetical protein
MALPKFKWHYKSLLSEDKVERVTLPVKLKIVDILRIKGQYVRFIYLYSSSCWSTFLVIYFAWFKQSSIIIFWLNFTGITWYPFGRA